MYLAASRGDVLVSDDLFYRQIASTMTKVDGAWLQVVLLAAHVAGQIDRARYAKSCAQLAYRRHSNLWIDDAALLVFSEECAEAEFAAVCHYIGSPGALMNAHTRLVGRFVSRIWRLPAPPLKRETLTSAVLTALLRHRRDDWHWYFALLWLGLEGHSAIEAYISRWVRGHFLPVRPINNALREWRYFFGRFDAASAVSRRAMQADLWPLRAVILNLGDTPPKTSNKRLDTRPDDQDGKLKKHARSKRWRRRRRPRYGFEP